MRRALTLGNYIIHFRFGSNIYYLILGKVRDVSLIHFLPCQMSGTLIFTDLERIAKAKPVHELCYVSASHGCYLRGRPCPHPKYHCFLFTDIIAECPPMSRKLLPVLAYTTQKCGKQNQRTWCLC